MILHAYVDVYVLCVCIVNRGHGYTTDNPWTRWVTVVTAVHDYIDASTWKGINESYERISLIYRLYQEFK